MSSKEWRRRIIQSHQAALEGRPGALNALCDELAAMAAPKAAVKPAATPVPATAQAQAAAPVVGGEQSKVAPVIPPRRPKEQ